MWAAPQPCWRRAGRAVHSPDNGHDWPQRMHAFSSLAHHVDDDVIATERCAVHLPVCMSGAIAACDWKQALNMAVWTDCSEWKRTKAKVLPGTTRTDITSPAAAWVWPEHASHARTTHVEGLAQGICRHRLEQPRHKHRVVRLLAVALVLGCLFRGLGGRGCRVWCIRGRRCGFELVGRAHKLNHLQKGPG